MKNFLFLLGLLTGALTVSAAERPATKMRQVALRTLNNASAKQVLSKPTLEVYSDGARFSIVSRDDRFPEVLAYGVGRFDIEQAPANVRWWFDRIQRSMEEAVRENAPRRVTRSYAPIAPLMETKWGQGAPYNNYTPIVGGEKTPTGCVATAMAQIMNYQRFPAEANFEGSYTANDNSYTETVSTTYFWPYQLAYGPYLPTADAQAENMSYTFPQGNKVAQLLRDCGYAVDMIYDVDGSGAYTYMSGVALVEKFSYPQKSVKYLIRDYYADDEWMNMLYTELENDSPVLYSGYSDGSGGHAFVFHGMDSEGRFFVNWGWQGQFDGYYAFDVLTPGKNDFSELEDVVIGIRPTALSTDAILSCFATDIPYKISYDNTTKKLNFEFLGDIFNATSRTFTGRWCLVVEDMEQPDNTEYFDLFEFDDEENALLPMWGFNSWSDSDKLTFKPGAYHVYFATLDVGEENWQYMRTIGGAFYYDMTVAADGTVTIADVPTFTASSEIPSAIHEIRQQPAAVSSEVRYYDLQGRELSSPAQGFIIRRQGNETKKIMVK